LEFSVYDDDSVTRIFLKKDGVYEPFYLDEVLIKGREFSLYRRAPGWVTQDNFWYKLPDNGR